MERYIFDIEHSENQGDWPFSVYVKKVNIDPKGYDFCKANGKTFKIAMKKAVETIIEKEK